MIQHNAEIYYLMAIIIVGRSHPAEAIAGIIALALAKSPHFWKCAAGVKDLSFKGLRIRNRG